MWEPKQLGHLLLQYYTGSQVLLSKNMIILRAWSNVQWMRMADPGTELLRANARGLFVTPMEFHNRQFWAIFCRISSDLSPAWKDCRSFLEWLAPSFYYVVQFYSSFELLLLRTQGKQKECYLYTDKNNNNNDRLATAAALAAMAANNPK